MSPRNVDSMEQPSGDDENSACIGESSEPEQSQEVSADTQSGPEATEVYGGWWE